MEFKGTKGKWLNDNGEIHNDNGRFIADCLILDEEDLYNSILISKAPEMLKELQETLKDLLCIQGSIYNSSRIDARWEGVYDIIQKQIDRKKQLIKQATEL